MGGGRMAAAGGRGAMTMGEKAGEKAGENCGKIIFLKKLKYIWKMFENQGKANENHFLESV